MNTLQKILATVGVAAGVGAAGYGLYLLAPQKETLRGEPIRIERVERWGQDELYMLVQTEDKKLVPAYIQSNDENIWYAKELLDIEQAHKDKHPIKIRGIWNNHRFYVQELSVHDAKVRF